MDAAQDLTKFWNHVVDILELNQENFPFALLYSVVNGAEPKTLDKSTATVHDLRHAPCIPFAGVGAPLLSD